MTMCVTGCASGPFGSGDPVLVYGGVNERGGYRCKSELIGITCTVMVAGQKGFGKGFRISRSGIVRVG